MYDSRRTSYSSSRSASTVSNSSMTSEPDIRKTSLKEMPSYRVEASKALNRRDDLVDLHKRLSSNRDLLNADPATKPWLKFRSISQNGNNIRVRDANPGVGGLVIPRGGELNIQNPTNCTNDQFF